MGWAAIWHAGVTQDRRGLAVHREPEEIPLQALSLWPEIAAPRARRGAVRPLQGAATARRAMSLHLLPDGALRVLHGEFLDQSTPPGFLGPGQLLTLRLP